MRSAFDSVSFNSSPGPPTLISLGSLSQAVKPLPPIGGWPVEALASAPVVRAADEETDDEDDASEPEIVVPPAEPLETASDFDEDDFDDDFDDDFEEEFEDDEFDSEVTPEDLEASDDASDPFEDN